MSFVPATFDITLTGKYETFNTIAKDFTQRITIAAPVDLVRVLCWELIDNGTEIKYVVGFEYGAVRTQKFDLKQSTFERLVQMPCEDDGILNTMKYKQLLADIELALLDFKLSTKSLALLDMLRKASTLQAEIIELKSELVGLTSKRI